MKFTLLALAAVITALSFTSCKKDTTTNTSTDRLKTYTEDVTSAGVPNGHEVDSFNLSYDGNGRLVSLVSVTMPPEKIVYTYTGTNTFTTDITADDNSVLHVIAYLKNSLIDSSYQTDGMGDTSTEKYIYNSNQQLVHLYDYDYSAIPGNTFMDDDTYDTYASNGNLLQETDSSSITTDTYTYYDSLSVTVNLTYPFQPNGINKSVNLPKTVTQIQSGADPLTFTFTYTFDSQKRLIASQGIGSDGSIAIKRYTYY
jgi:hypothetical protein